MIINRADVYQEGFEWFGVVLEYLGDINGDGFDDFYAGSEHGYDSLDFIFFGGPDFDTIPDVTLADHTVRARYAGDVNNDGYGDFMTGYDLPWSGAGYLHIYFGGPDIDSIPDFSIYNYEFEGYQNYFAMDCSGIGDFNGDGIDDYAFSALDNSSRGRIYICSGWDEATAVNYSYEPTLPKDFGLKYNYPNPFNSTTTIEFDLPCRTKTKLSIYDILGREVVKLINKELPTGSYKINWSGRDQENRPMSSGIYFYQLTADEFSQTRKMVLVK